MTHSHEDKVTFSQADNGRSEWNQSGPQGSYPLLYYFASILSFSGRFVIILSWPDAFPSCRIFSLPTGSPCQTLRRMLFVILGLTPFYIIERERMEGPWVKNHKAEQGVGSHFSLCKSVVCKWTVVYGPIWKSCIFLLLGACGASLYCLHAKWTNPFQRRGALSLKNIMIIHKKG